MRLWLVGQTSGGEKAGDVIENINNNACEAEKVKFNAKWLTDCEWLVLDHENVVMFCKGCRM